MRKGQAAMEFLMTYGWAILVVLAAIGALAYFGVLSPDKFLPDKCTANPPFSCGEYKVSAASGINMSLQNNAGADVYIISVKLKCDSTAAGQLMDQTLNDTTLTANGEKNYVTVTKAQAEGASAGCDAISNGGKFKATYDIVYKKSGEGQTHTGSGSIQARAEA